MLKLNHTLTFLVLTLALAVCSCSRRTAAGSSPEGYGARWFALEGDSLLVSISPFDGSRDSLLIEHPYGRIICMSSSHVGFLEALGCDSVAVGVSGVGYLWGEKVRASAAEVGYDAALDYETVLKLNPDLVLAYSVSASVPPYVAKLRSLGVRVIIINEHLESHPLARAEYLRFIGALTGRLARADSLFGAIKESYLSRVVHAREPRKVILNIPYAGIWYVPGEDNYMSQLIRDAGGVVLGAQKGLSGSSVISLEEALAYGMQADIWLNPGGCRTKAQLYGINDLFRKFPSEIYNNNLRTVPSGGNDFWESGVVRPDLVLSDLCNIFSGTDAPLNYHIRLE